MAIKTEEQKPDYFNQNTLRVVARYTFGINNTEYQEKRIKTFYDLMTKEKSITEDRST